mmetsp:Transcript_19846/g.64567  ORF Transcript_19846/g.64567 Transcript_19846/m.64567 type:complete len:236 (+) Transcript_19846:147-854(+)
MVTTPSSTWRLMQRWLRCSRRRGRRCIRCTSRRRYTARVWRERRVSRRHPRLRRRWWRWRRAAILLQRLGCLARATVTHSLSLTCGACRGCAAATADPHIALEPFVCGRVWIRGRRCRRHQGCRGCLVDLSLRLLPPPPFGVRRSFCGAREALRFRSGASARSSTRRASAAAERGYPSPRAPGRCACSSDCYPRPQRWPLLTRAFESELRGRRRQGRVWRRIRRGRGCSGRGRSR